MPKRWLYTVDDLKAKCVTNERGCWLWQGHTDTRGYGQVWIAQKFTLLHRWAYEQVKGPLGKLHACHDCDTPNCVNPDHITPGTAKHNAQDRQAKNRSTGGVKPKLSYALAEHIRKLHADGMSLASLARQYKVWHTTIRDIVIGDSWVKESGVGYL